MSAYAGSLVPVSTPYVALDRIPLILLLGALVVACSRGRLEARQRHAASLVATGMSLGLWAVHAVQLFTLDPARRALRDVTTNLARIGSLDANLSFFLDPFSVVLLLLPLAGATFFLARTKIVETNEPSTGRFHAAVLLLSAGASAALMADNFICLLMGLSVAIVATYLLILRDEQLTTSVPTANRVFLLQGVGVASLFAACGFLFWSLGGAWQQDGYISDYRARFVAVHAPGHLQSDDRVIMPSDAPRGERDAALVAQRAKEKGTLTFTSYPGARVFIDAGDKVLERAEPFGVTPFVRKELSTGPHDVVIVAGGAAIVTGDGHEIAWIERLQVDAGEDVALIPLGQTVTFSEIDDQLGLVDEDSKHFLSNALFHRLVFGSWNVVSVVVFLAALGAFFLGAPVFLVPWFAGVSSTATWNVLRVSTVALALIPLLRLQALVSFHLNIVVAVFLVAAFLAWLVRSRRPSLILGTATFALVALQGTARADDAPGRLVMRPESGDVVELGYAPDGETMVGWFVIRNDGAKPLTITGARFVHSDAVPRVPPFVSIELDGTKGEPAVLEPGKQRRVIVRWKYEAARAREFFGLAYVEPSDTRVGGLVPVHASRSRDLGPWGDRALSFIVAFPLVAALLALVLRLVRRDTPRTLAGASALVFAVQLAFIVAVRVRFDEQFARADGNDGLQLIERSVWLPNWGVEWFLGLDGLSLALILVISIAALLAAVASWSRTARAFGFHAIAPIFFSSVMGIFLAQDLFLFCLCWFVGTIAATWLIAIHHGKRTRQRAIGFGAVSLAGAVFLGAAALWLHGHSDASYLVDGRFVPNTWSFLDLAHVDWVHVVPTLFGTNGVVIVWSALFITFVSRLVVVGTVIAEADAPTNMLVPAALASTSVYGLLRINMGIVPAGARWAATTIILVGLLMIFGFAWLSRKQTNLQSFVAHTSMAYSGFALVGMGSITPQGIAASVGVVSSLTLALGLLAMLTEAFESRAQTAEMKGFTGLAGTMPLFAAGFFAAILLLMGLPLLAGFWGSPLAALGVFPRQPALGLFTLVALVFLGATQINVAGRFLFGAPNDPKHDFSDLGRHERLVLLPLGLLAVGLGLAPRMLFSTLDAFLLDLHRWVDAVGALQVG